MYNSMKIRTFLKIINNDVINIKKTENCYYLMFDNNNIYKFHNILLNNESAIKEKYNNGLFIYHSDKSFDKSNYILNDIQNLTRLLINNDQDMTLSYIQIDKMCKDLLHKDMPNIGKIKNNDGSIHLTNIKNYKITSIDELNKTILFGNIQRNISDDNCDYIYTISTLSTTYHFLECNDSSYINNIFYLLNNKINNQYIPEPIDSIILSILYQCIVNNYPIITVGFINSDSLEIINKTCELTNKFYNYSEFIYFTENETDNYKKIIQGIEKQNKILKNRLENQEELFKDKQFYHDKKIKYFLNQILDKKIDDSISIQYSSWSAIVSKILALHTNLDKEKQKSIECIDKYYSDTLETSGILNQIVSVIRLTKFSNYKTTFKLTNNTIQWKHNNKNKILYFNEIHGLNENGKQITLFTANKSYGFLFDNYELKQKIWNVIKLIWFMNDIN